MASDEQAALRRLVDKDEIVDLVHRYSYGVDHRLYDEVAELFTEDCVVDYGPAFALRCAVASVLRDVRAPWWRFRGDESPQCERPRDLRG